MLNTLQIENVGNVYCVIYISLLLYDNEFVNIAFNVTCKTYFMKIELSLDINYNIHIVRKENL